MVGFVSRGPSHWTCHWDWLANCQKNLAKYGKVPAMDWYCVHEDWQCSYPLHTMVTGIRHSNSVRADIANALM